VPRVYGTVSPLDPQIFVSINDAVDDLLNGTSNSRYSPMEVAQWLDGYTVTIDRDIADIARTTRNTASPIYRRAVLDIQLQSGLGKFFAAKIRSAAFFAVYQKAGDPAMHDHALNHYRKARDAWSALATLAKGRYMDDITYGKIPNMRGDWADRLPAIEADIEAMQSAKYPVADSMSNLVKQATIQQILSAKSRPEQVCEHHPAATFRPGIAHEIRIKVPSNISAVRMIYRHVNQAEYYQTSAMEAVNGTYVAIIPTDYTQSEFALQYYFELQLTPASATMYPGLGPDLTQRPYFLIEQTPDSA
jgi:hypothetical protein